MFDPGRGDTPIQVELAPIRKTEAGLVKFYLIKNGKLYKTTFSLKKFLKKLNKIFTHFKQIQKKLKK